MCKIVTVVYSKEACMVPWDFAVKEIIFHSVEISFRKKQVVLWVNEQITFRFKYTTKPRGI